MSSPSVKTTFPYAQLSLCVITSHEVFCFEIHESSERSFVVVVSVFLFILSSNVDSAVLFSSFASLVQIHCSLDD